MPQNPFLQVRSPKFKVLSGEDDELVNEGTYGKALALYLQDALARRGYQTPQIVCEDWGWWVTISGLPFTCGLGVYGQRIAGSEDLELCVTVQATRGRKWSWSRLKMVDTTLDVDRLHETIRCICNEDSEISVVAESEEFPF